MNIEVVQNQTLLPISVQSVKSLVLDFAAFYEIKFDEAIIHFVDTPTISDLHHTFFDDPSPTDCISFPMDESDEEGYRVLGEIFVCPETALKYIRIHGGDIYHEITLYTIHGLLHLLGYCDIDEEETVVMRFEEVRYLKHVENKELWIHS